MLTLTRACNSTEAARRILAAFDAADLPLMEAELDRSVELLPPLHDLPPAEAERQEVLQAVAAGMRRDMARMRRGLAKHLECAEAQLGLLLHLARLT